MPKVSAVIICNNEEKHIAACIDSVAEICDDIVIVDSGSTDRTLTIATKKGARIFHKAFEGYGQNKNFGNEMAIHDWILSIDGDEVLSAELIKNLQRLSLVPKTVYALNSLVNHSGYWIRHCGWYPRYKNRLFNKRECAWNFASVHEEIEPLNDKKIVKLKGDILHYSYPSKEMHFIKAQNYASLKASKWKENNATISRIKSTFYPMVVFLKIYFYKLGFLDGKMGLFIAKMDFHMYKKALQIFQEKSRS